MARKSMVDLGEKFSKTEMAQPKRSEVYHPSFSTNKDLGLSENDAGKTIMAVVKLKVKEVGKRANEQGKKHTNHFEVLGMIPNPSRTSHYKTE